MSGLTPLMVAILRAQESQECEEVVEGVVRLLAEDDDRLDLPDLNGRTALHLASMLRQGFIFGQMLKGGRGIFWQILGTLGLNKVSAIRKAFLEEYLALC